jgi:hypothetical protein
MTLLSAEAGYRVHVEDVGDDRVKVVVDFGEFEETTPLPAADRCGYLLTTQSRERSVKLYQRAFHERQLQFKVAQRQISPETAQLFKALGKTMPVMWSPANDTSMLIMNVVIPAPYTHVAPLNADRADEQLLERLQRLLEHERAKIFPALPHHHHHHHPS